MKPTELGDRLKELRSTLNKSQKDFAEYIGIPQPSMSAYENGRNSPTIDVLVEIADKCNISMDWLCGRTNTMNSISDLSEIAEFFYEIMETNEIGCEIDVHDHIENGLDIEKAGETDDRYRWYTRLTFYGNDNRYKYNSNVCNIIRKIKEHIEDVEYYRLDKDDYETVKEKVIEYHHNPITKWEIPTLTREERIRKQFESLSTLDSNGQHPKNK